MGSVDFKVMKKEDLQTSRWSGGTTTEIFIYPPDSLYARRDFSFRISTASVEDEESVFTQLTGFKRHIMPLEGKMCLEHENHHSISLESFEKDFFDGGWVTKSYGKCRDFNLMLAEGFDGDISPVKADDVEIFSAKGFMGFYILCGCLAEIASEGKIIEKNLENGDFLAFSFTDNPCDGNYVVKFRAEAENIFASVKVIVRKRH